MQPTTSQRARKSRDVLAELTRFFLRSLSEPSMVRPTVRCISRRDALALLVRARNEIAEPELRAQSGEALLELLEKSHVVQPVPTDAPGDARPAVYLIGPQPLASIDPLELLAAAEPSGVVCYFTALAYYGLTTQTPTHHHIARLGVGPPPAPSLGRSVPAIARRSAAPRNRFGTLLFQYQSVPYYRTSRGAHTIVGIQYRQINDRSIARITTREQTLLDTLHRPISCGGPSIVWEAWRTGLASLDEARMCSYLATLAGSTADSTFARRVGYVLWTLNYDPGAELGALLEETLRRLQSNADTPVIALFPGLRTVSVDSTWRVQVPLA
jgi:hypothetical protein